jgi:TetR/AcrR family transcriptional regulator
MINLEDSMATRNVKPGPSPGRRPGRPHATDSESTRNRILEVAREHFSAKGFGDATLRDMAAEARVNMATIHYHFGNKEHLFRRVVGDAADLMIERLTAAAADDRPPDERLGRAIEAYGDVLSKHPYLPRILIRQLMTAYSPEQEWFIREYASRGATLLPGILQDGIRDGKFRPIDLRYTFIALIAMCMFFHLAFPVFHRILGIGKASPGPPDTPVRAAMPSPSPEVTRDYSLHVLDLVLHGILSQDQNKECAS